MMEFESKPYIVYVRIDKESRITAVDSSAFLQNTEGWIEIDQGFGVRYHHARGNYFDKPRFDERGIYRYLYTPDNETLWRERTQEEMDEDYTPPVPMPDPAERIAALEEQLAAYEAAYQEGVNEA